MEGSHVKAIYATGKSEAGWDWCKVYLFLGGEHAVKDRTNLLAPVQECGEDGGGNR